MAFKGVDYYRIDDLLTEEERIVRDTVREFVEQEVMPIIAEYYERGEFPTHLVPKMAELGFFGAALPPEWGGSNLGGVAYGLLMQELERGDSGLRSFVSVQNALVIYPIYTFGSEEQKRKWLPKLVSGEAIGCFGLTEPDAGSDPASMRTRARRTDRGWVLNGTKMWITNGSIADVAVVWAKDDEGRVRGFLVEKGTPGFRAKDVKGKLSLRASVTSELILEDVEIPAENELPHTEGLKSALMCLTQARYGIAWGAVGAAMACFEEALEYSKIRVQFDKPIAAFQLTQEKLADMVGKITQGQLLVYRLGQLKDAGKMRYTHVSLAKRETVAMALWVARTARSILGANGITLEYHSMRHAANLESVYTYEGTHEIHTLIVGRDLTGIEAFA